MITAEKNSTGESIQEAARKLADYNMEVSPDLAGIYLFSSEDTVRLVILDPVTFPREEKIRLALPPGWGDWEEAIQLWPRE